MAPTRGRRTGTCDKAVATLAARAGCRGGLRNSIGRGCVHARRRVMRGAHSMAGTVSRLLLFLALLAAAALGACGGEGGAAEEGQGEQVTGTLTTSEGSGQ